MILGGDEIRRTQMGNNNAYCQDSPVSWYDYANVDRHPDIIRFVQNLNALRQAHPVFRRPDFFTGRDNNSDSFADISWFNELGQNVDWGRPEGLLGLRLDGKGAETQHNRDDNDFFLMMNATPYDQLFTIVKPVGKVRWHRCLDTALPAPADFCDHGKETVVDHEHKYLLQSRSMVVLLSR
jgi:glycogen operon protein